MSPEGEAEFRRVLKRIERRTNLVGGIVIACAAAGIAWLVYEEVPEQWGIAQDMSWWLAIAVFIAFGGLLGWQFAKE